MHITSEDDGEVLEMRVAGRLDNEWAYHLTDVIDEAVRRGSHSVVLDLSEVSYISSAGIGALVRAHKQFQAIRGFFGVGTAPPHVAEIIRMTGLAKMLLVDRDQIRGGSSRGTIQPMHRVAAEAGMSFEIYDIDPGAVLTCDVIGDPARLTRETYQADHCHLKDFPSNTLGLGLGAFGPGFKESHSRIGEFLAVAGAVAQQPTDRIGKPDFQLEQGKLVPQILMAYGLRCQGSFREQQRFDPEDAGNKIPLSVLVDQSLSLAGTSLAGMVLVAETSGLIGATLRQSPMQPAAEGMSRMSHPEIRKWLSFSPERAYVHSLAIVVGVASRGDPAGGMAADLAPLLRPLRSNTDLFGHFHAAVFSYRPFKKRKLDLTEIVGTLFESEDLQDVLHLVNDDREIMGGGESEFVRGACWLSPISSVSGGLSK